MLVLIFKRTVLRKYGEYMLNINKIFVAYRLFKENYLQKEYLHDIT